MELDEIFKQAERCEKCYGKGKKIWVPSYCRKNGEKNVDVMFINERPGRKGTGRSGYVSQDNNDPTAAFFRECFDLLCIDRGKIFITNACLCHPKYTGYTDKSPNITEIKNCTEFLSKQIKATNPKIIGTLGKIALVAMRYIYPESKQLRNFRNLQDVVAKEITDTDIPIVPLYHTSGYARITRKGEQQKQDWLTLKEMIRRKR